MQKLSKYKVTEDVKKTTRLSERTPLLGKNRLSYNDVLPHGHNCHYMEAINR